MCVCVVSKICYYKYLKIPVTSNEHSNVAFVDAVEYHELKLDPAHEISSNTASFTVY